MIDFPFDEECYGCGLCEEMCPVHAITMQENNDGFRIPVVNHDACIKCRKCEKFCIRLQGHQGIPLESSQLQACWQKDRDSRLKSTSGGVFFCVARAFIEKWHGVVCGCVWNKHMEAEIVAVESIADLEKMRGSKYVQATIRCYGQIKEYLKQGRKVLFSGTPCQVGAIQRLFPNNEHLYTIALFCELVPSPKVWRIYVSELEKRARSTMINAFHRKKSLYGWLLPESEYIFANGKKISTLACSLDPYVSNTLLGFFTRNSCIHCGYKGDNSSADIMVGDYWGLPKSILKRTGNAGCSVICVNTAAGRVLVQLTGDVMESEPVAMDDIVPKNPMLLQPVEKNPKRDAVLAYMGTHSFHETITAFCNTNSKKSRRIALLHLFRVAGIVKRLMYPYGKEHK